jgi:hypothetical protein
LGGTGSLQEALGRLSLAIRKITATRSLIASLAFFLVMAALINGSPFGLAQLRGITGGPTILDMTFTTGPDQVYAVLDSLGEAGRAFDLTRIVPLDLVFPFSYALFLSVAITWILLRILPEDSPWIAANLLPVIAGAADYCENAGVIAMLLTYPTRLDAVAAFTSAMYVIKFTFSAASYCVLLGALAILGIAWLQGRAGRAA